jgi:hypothetical protein
MILLVGIILWYGFYFADKYWYHALLIGSVKHGSALEEELRKYLPEAGLTDAISEASPQKPSALEFWLPRDKTTGKMRSTNKLNAFYAIGAVALGITAVALEIISFIPKPSPPKVDRVIEVIKPTPTTGPDSNSSTTTAPTTATITTIAPPPPPPSIPSSPTPAPGPGTPTPNQTGS